MALILHTTADCRNVIGLAACLEETTLSYTVEGHPDGHFLERFGQPGPRLVHDGLGLLQVHAAIRHVARIDPSGRLWPEDPAVAAQADECMEYLATRIRPAIVALGRATEVERPRARDALVSLLERLDTRIEGPHLAGPFTAADYAYTTLLALPRFGLSLEPAPRLVRSLERTTARPAFARAKARLAALALPAAATAAPALTRTG